MFEDENSHRKQEGYCNDCAGDCQYDSDGNFIGDFIQDNRILLVQSRITGECHWEIFYFDGCDFITKKIWGDYEDAEADLNFLIEKDMEVFEYKEVKIIR
jgi:hypothetical protein